MTLRTIFFITAALVLGTSLLLGSASAKPKCRKLCKDDIKACLQSVPANSTCTGTPAEKRMCKKGLRTQRRDCKTDSITACKNDMNPDPNVCSPSGAFLDPTLPL